MSAEPTNKQRKVQQKASYHAMYKPHRKPRSRTWQKGYRPEQVKVRIGK